MYYILLLFCEGLDESRTQILHSNSITLFRLLDLFFIFPFWIANWYGGKFCSQRQGKFVLPVDRKFWRLPRSFFAFVFSLPPSNLFWVKLLVECTWNQELVYSLLALLPNFGSSCYLCRDCNPLSIPSSYLLHQMIWQITWCERYRKGDKNPVAP